MKSTLMIKDLSLDKQLDSQAMSAVHGGTNTSTNGSLVQQGNGGGIASPVVGIFAPTTTQADFKFDLANLTNVLGNMNAAVAQA